MSVHSTKYHAKILYRDLTVEFIDGGYFCQIPVHDVAIDADGAPDAYGPKSKWHAQGCGTDYLSSAGYPNNDRNPIKEDKWQNILVPDPTNPDEPYLRGNHYISKTSLYDKTKDDLTSGKFVDANTVCYIVMPRFWIDHLDVKLGDLCLLWHARLKRRIVAIVADTCPAEERLGEMSVAAAKALGGEKVSPKTGVDFPENGSIHCYIFKRSKPKLKWPLTDDFVQSFRPALESRLRAGRRIMVSEHRRPRLTR